MDYLFGSAQVVVRLMASAWIACRRIRWFRDPDGVHRQEQGPFSVDQHRKGDHERQVIPPRPVDPFAHHGKVPWGWIGTQEDRNDFTEDLAEYMVPGNVITPGFLWQLFPEISGETVKYLSTDTQEIRELPSDGITIDALTHA